MTESRVVDAESQDQEGPPAPATSTKTSSRAWSSGRQLTEAQRQRKRAINNATRRTRRQQRRADQILLLELELEKLRARSLDGDGDDDDDEDRGDAIRTDGPAGSETEVEGSGQAPVMNPVTTQTHPAGLLYSGPSPQAPATSATAMVPYPGAASSDATWTCGNASYDLDVLGVGESFENSAQVSLPYLMREPAGRDTTEALNDCVDRSLFSNVPNYSEDEELYQSILAYGVLYGWDTSIEIHATYCPLLRTIRFLDECFMYDVGPLNRLSIIYVVFKQLQVRLHTFYDQKTSH